MTHQTAAEDKEHDMKSDVPNDIQRYSPKEIGAPKASPAAAVGERLEYVTFLHAIEHDEHDSTETFRAADGYELRLATNIVTISRRGEETWVPLSGVSQMAPLKVRP